MVTAPSSEFQIFDWIPEEYTEETVPDSIRPHWSQWWITVTCEGEVSCYAFQITSGHLTHNPRTLYR